ncbi:MAG: class I SAM-dependent methyltransferase [Nanoarchaeota archaeon]|nr:class I SAM-dependent methyltransferase [Nanoarchaeota archaeon]
MDFKKPKLNSDLVEYEFKYYLRIIKEVMLPGFSFLELGPGRHSISDYFPDVTIVENNIDVLKTYAEKKRKVMCADYYQLVIKPKSFDYVVALHPNIYYGGENIEWIDSKDRSQLFRFNNSNLEKFVLSLRDISRKGVFIGSKKIADNPPFENFASTISSSHPPYVIYQKAEQFDSLNLRDKLEEV